MFFKDNNLVYSFDIFNSKFYDDSMIFTNTKYWKEKKEGETIIGMSRLLNKAMNRVGQLSCEISKIDVSQNGGWCSTISGKNSTQHLTDYALAKFLSEFLRDKHVASFGDGPGVYKEFILNLNQVKSYDAFDGAPFAELTTNNNVKFLDLSVPIYHLKRYDWVISLEVAEHIPAEYESVYLDNLVRHSVEGIILSWAQVGQGGHSHVNTRNFPYIKEKMEARGFIHDPKSSEVFRNVSAFSWFKTNINVYRNKNFKVYQNS